VFSWETEFLGDGVFGRRCFWETVPRVKTVLFLCTGNYYRSRYAEIRFNDLAQRSGLTWRAESRGLAPHPHINPGPMSRYTIEALDRLGMTYAEHLRDPMAVVDFDFDRSHLVIALKEAEHRAMVERDFPHRAGQVEYWHVHDLDCSEPAATIDEIERLLTALVGRLLAK
jgi:protein-tyrosine phosphatase